MKRLAIIMLSVFLCVTIISCRDNNQIQQSKNVLYGEAITKITEAVQQYVNENADYTEKSNEEIASDIALITESEYAFEYGSGRVIQHFIYDEHLSFEVADIPIRECFFLIDNTIVSNVRIW